jgi:hypothetical protein
MDIKLCPVCGAKWIGGQHYWSGTGKKGNELDLAGLVCNDLPNEKKPNCANPCLGKEGGDTWEKRLKQSAILLQKVGL